jgi:ornithine cyclodeaminase/alanine dehydrogenase-like protein (mu-crystallin family)
MLRTPLILDRDAVRAALPMPQLIEVCGDAFAQYSAGRAAMPSVIHLDLVDHQAEVHVKAGYLLGGSSWAVKVASGFPENAASGSPTSDGLVLVFDAATGALRALLHDHGYLTDARTGAAGGVAARHLAPTTVRTVAVIGTGAQARFQLDGLAVVRPGIEEVRVWGRVSSRTERCVEDLGRRKGLPLGCRYTRADSVEAAVRGADLVITCTASRKPLVRAEWISPGCHITAVGSDGVGKQELDPALLGRADRIAVDSRDQCARLGELQHAIAAGMALDDRVVELGEIVAGVRPGRQADSELTICDLTGVGVQDVAAATLVLEHAAG